MPEDTVRSEERGPGSNVDQYVLLCCSTRTYREASRRPKSVIRSATIKLLLEPFATHLRQIRKFNRRSKKRFELLARGLVGCSEANVSLWRSTSAERTNSRGESVAFTILVCLSTPPNTYKKLSAPSSTCAVASLCLRSHSTNPRAFIPSFVMVRCTAVAGTGRRISLTVTVWLPPSGSGLSTSTLFPPGSPGRPSVIQLSRPPAALQRSSQISRS